MGIGADIAEVLQENGGAITITKPNESVEDQIITGEYFDQNDIFADSSTEFLRQFGMSGSFQYDSVIEAGDIVTISTNHYLVVSRKLELYEGEIVTIEGFLLKCNTDGKFVSLAPGSRNANQEITLAETVLFTGVKGCLYERTHLDNDMTDVVNLPVHSNVLYTTNFSTVNIGDRFYPDKNISTEYYQVVYMHKRKFEGCLIVFLNADSR